MFVEFRNKNYMANLHFSEIVNGMASNAYPYYHVFDLIGKAIFTRISEIKWFYEKAMDVFYFEKYCTELW